MENIVRYEITYHDFEISVMDALQFTKTNIIPKIAVKCSFRFKSFTEISSLFSFKDFHLLPFNSSSVSDTINLDNTHQHKSDTSSLLPVIMNQPVNQPVISNSEATTKSGYRNPLKIKCYLSSGQSTIEHEILNEQWFSTKRGRDLSSNIKPDKKETHYQENIYESLENIEDDTTALDIQIARHDNAIRELMELVIDSRYLPPNLESVLQEIYKETPKILLLLSQELPYLAKNRMHNRISTKIVQYKVKRFEQIQKNVPQIEEQVPIIRSFYRPQNSLIIIQNSFVQILSDSIAFNIKYTSFLSLLLNEFIAVFKKKEKKSRKLISEILTILRNTEPHPPVSIGCRKSVALQMSSFIVQVGEKLIKKEKKSFVELPAYINLIQKLTRGEQRICSVLTETLTKDDIQTCFYRLSGIFHDESETTILSFVQAASILFKIFIEICLKEKKEELACRYVSLSGVLDIFSLDSQEIRVSCDTNYLTEILKAKIPSSRNEKKTLL
jgi:hypothetical protein